MKPLVACLALLLSSPAFAGLFGASGSDHDCTKTRSFAWCLMDLADISSGVHDSAPDKLPKGMTYNEVDQTINTVGNVVEAAAGVSDLVGATNIMRLGSLGGLMNIMSALQGFAPPPGTYLNSVAVVEVEDPKAAVEIAANALLESTMEFLGATNHQPRDGKPDGAFGSYRAFVEFSGGELCSAKKCQVMSGLFGKNPYANSRATSVDTPVWYAQATGATATKLTLLAGGAIPSVYVDGQEINVTVSSYGISKHLPKGMYFYLPIVEKKPVATLLNNNKEYFFVKPPKTQ